MCYAIPGKVIEINGDAITVDYFGERRKARNEFYELSPGEYVYAQGGFVIQRIPEDEALISLETWKDFFFRLKEVDLRLAEKPKTLHQIANATRSKHLGNACCVHGIIEFSNYCRCDCLYCGIRKGNSGVGRYRMSVDEIIEASRYAIRKLNFKALVLQSGEDLSYSEDDLARIVSMIMSEDPVLLIMSIGGRDFSLYKKLYEKGARGALLRFESGNPSIYGKIKPGEDLKDRLDLIKNLRDLGYLVFTGFLIGLPGQTDEDILNDIDLAGSLNCDMFSFGPFIPHPQTPLKDTPLPSLDSALSTIARARIMYPESKILATTALETLDKEKGLKAGLLAGANSLMINVTPKKYQNLYEIYPDRASVETELAEKVDSTIKLLQSIGRAPTDIGI